MSRHIKEVLNGNGTTLHINETDYVSVCKGGEDVMIRAGGLVLAFDTWADFVKAIDRSKAAWSEGKEV